METEELITLTPPELYRVQQKRRQENEKEASRVKDFFRTLLLQTMREEIEKEKVLVCETRLSVSRLLRSEGIQPVIIDISFALKLSPFVRVIFPSGQVVEIEMKIGNNTILETRILPKDTNEFQRLKTYLSEWESRSTYLPRKGEPEMVLLKVEDCTGKPIKEICEITISKVKDIVSGDIRLRN